MADTHETIADIRRDAEAKFRELVEAYMQRRTAFQTTVGAMQAFNTVFDRLEAAHRRDTKELRVEIERLKEERNYSGVRERERLRANGFAIVPKEQLERGDAAKLREALDESRRIASDLGGCRLNDYWKLNEIVRVCEAALATPPRNCDRPECATTKAAQDVWRREDGGKTAYYEWLLATHKKGGNDAD